MNTRIRYIMFGLLSLAVLYWWGSRDPLPQDVAYHDFADQRSLLGIPNALDVLSNFAFLAVGLWGLGVVWNARRHPPGRMFLDRRETAPYLVMFLGVTLVSLGSAYYHLSPDNQTLVWDRLPMTIGFAAFFISVLMERTGLRFAYAILFPVVVVSAATVFYWSWTESLGRGDLRPYFFVQFYPLLAVPALMALFPPRYTGSANLLGVVAFYVLAKFLEIYDTEIYDATGILSGHTLKHLSAAIAVVWIVRMLKVRQPAVLTEPG